MHARFLVIFAALAAPCFAAQPGPPPAPPCTDIYVCGQQGPEDLVGMGSDWAVASAYAGTGGVTLIRIRDRMSITAYPSASARERLDAKTYPQCPGPPRGAFTTHGVYVAPGKGPVHKLFVVGHGARESIEVFEADTRGAMPVLTWTGCAIAPDPIGLNSVRGLPDGGFITTNFLPRNQPMQNMMSGAKNGELWEWHASSGWQKIPGSEASGANGVELSDDGRTLYVAAWGSQSFFTLSRGAKTPVRKEIDLGFRIDNIHWAKDGTLLGAGQVGQDWRVVKIHPRTLEVEQIYAQKDMPGFGGGTVALEVGDALWVGSYRGDRIAVVPKPVNTALWPRTQAPFRADAQLERSVTELLAKMTLEEKIGQVIQPDIGSVTPADMRRYHFGAILNGGNSAPDKDEFAPPGKWLALADAFYAASIDRSNGGLGIPSLWGTDAMHGHSNIIGATLFPHNIGLGAARDPALIEAIGAVTAAEIRATGIEWTFAPTLTVPQDSRWGRTYEGYSEDPRVVTSYAAAMVRGLQGKPGSRDFLSPPHVMATAKHFLGDGGTTNGLDQGDTRVTEMALRDTHGAPYVPAINAGLLSIMASYNSWNGAKMHGHQGLLTDVLKQRMGFQGFVVGDWNGHGQVLGCRATNCAAALNAGLDMYMAPDSWRGLYDSLLAQAKSGELSMSRLDDAVARILRVKFRMGLFDAGPPSQRAGAGNFATLGASAHRELARRAVRESLVLLKNNGALLPLAPRQHVLVTGDGAHNYAKQSGGWSLTWQGTGADNSRFPGATSIWEGVRDTVQRAGGSAETSADGSFKARPGVAIVVFGENPYAEGVGDRRNLLLRADGSTHLEILAKLKAASIPVVAVFLSGRPLWVNRELNASQAFIAAWLPGSEGAGVADLLFRSADGRVAHDFRGKLSFSWPKTATQYALHRDQPGYDPLFAFGFGLTYRDRQELPLLSEESGVTGADAPGGTLFGGVEATAWRMGTGGGVQLTRFDRQRQEDSFRLLWSGTSGALRLDSAQGEDFSRETNADMMLVLTVRVDAAPDAATTLTASCGAGCEASVPITADLAALPAGQWLRLGVPLKCFTRAGADMGRRVGRFELGSAGRLDLSVNRIALGTDVDRRASCPVP